MKKPLKTLKMRPSSAFEDPATTRARLASDQPGELHFTDTLDYVKFVSGALNRSHMKFSNVASGGGMSPSTVSNMAHGVTKYPRFGTITGILGALGYETIIRAGGKKP